jgi:heme/copper-type cytochrome/quinol oxidase subunit 1
MDIWALVIATIGAVAIVRMVVTGSAAADGKSLRRDEEPVVYWTVIVAAILIVAFLLGLGVGIW